MTGTSITAAGTGPGCYGWRHHLVLSPSGATAESGPTDPGETTLVMYPTASTSLNLLQASIGSYLTDTLTLTGSYGQPVRVSGQLQTAKPQLTGRSLACPLAASGAWTNAATVANIGPFTITRDGQHPVPGRYLTTQALCYSFTYQATVTLDPAAPDPSARSIQLTLPAGDQGETALINTPTITTSSSTTNTSPATTITDQIRIAGLQLPAGDTAILRVYYLGTEPILPTPGDDTSAPACANAAVLDRLPAEGRPGQAGCNPTGWEHTPIAAAPAPITVTGDGSYTTDPITLPTAAGYGTWVETLTYNGITVAITPPGTPSETVHAAAPAIGTAAASTDPTGGGAIVSDTLNVTGLQLQPGDTASITAHLLTALSDGTSCNGVDWSVADHDGDPTSLDLPGDGHYNTTPVPVELGCHTYYEQLLINGHPVTTEAEQPGQAAETLLITGPTGPTPTASPSGNPTPAPSSTPGPSPTPASHDPSPPAVTPPPVQLTEGRRHSLANTGTNTSLIEMAGGLTIATGCLLLLLARRRRSNRVQAK